MKKLKKTLAMILCLAMCLSMFPASAFAEEGAAEAPAEQVVEPVNEEPVYEEPVNQEPVNQEPVNQEPVNEEPVYEEPVNQEPVNEEPVNQEPVNQEPATAEPEMPAPVRVIFEVPAEGAAVRVYTKDESLNETDVAAEEDGSFLLLPGQYYYIISAEGYAETEETEFTVEASEETFTVAVEMTLSGTGSDADSAEAALTVAEILTGTGVSYYTPENDGTTNEELLTEYAAQQLEKAKRSGGGMLMAPGRPTSGLNPAQTKAYYILKDFITETAAGSRPLTQYAVNFDSDFISENLTWTPATLPGGGYESFTEENLQAAAEQGYEATMALGPLHTALLNTLPFELYWYDKTMGVMCNYSFSASKMSNGSIGSVSITGITYIFTVAEAYKDGQTYATDGSGNAIRNPNNGRAYPIGVRDVGSTINDAVANAQAVVNNCSAFTDLGKLTEYKNYICSQVSYNHAAASDDYDLGYGDPWQLIYAFDNDASTNIVCEGYSKAFEYLCDLSTFSDSDVRAYCVTGTMDGGTGAGAHMWNIVSMDDGRNYLVDVTNCDEGSVGSPDQLFLKGCARGNADEGYVFSCNNGLSNITYVYDSDTHGYYNTEELTVSAYDYGYAPSALDQLKTAISNMTTPYSLGNVTALTITENLEIPAGMRVEAPNAVITIPAGVTLTVNGTLFLPGGQNGLAIEAGGALVIREDGKVELHGAPYLTTVNGDLRVGGRLYLSRGHWGNLNDAGSLANITTVGESSEIHVEMLVQAQESLDQMLDVMSSTNVPEALADVTRLDFTIAFPWTLEHDYSFPAGINVYIQNNGTNETGSVTVPAGSSLTVNGYFALRGAEMTVNGTLINNGTVHLRAGGQTGTASTLTLSNGASCLGDGEVWVYYDAANELIDNTGLFTQISDDGSVIVYRLAEQPDNTSFETAIELTDGQTFEVTGSEDGVTRYYKFTPTQSNYYGFKFLDYIWIQDLDVYSSDHTRIGYGEQYSSDIYSLPYLNASETYYFALNIGEEGSALLQFGYDNHLRVRFEDNEWDKLVSVGERVTLKVVAEAQELTGVTYQWIGPDGEDLEGETTDTLTTDPIVTKTFYGCRVTDQYGNETSAVAQIRVDNGLTVTAAGLETTPFGSAILQLPLGASYTLTANVEAYDLEGITYRWEKSDIDSYGELEETGNSVTGIVTGNAYYYLTVTDRYQNQAYLNIEIRVDNQLTAFVDGTNEVAKTYFVNPGETVTMKARVSAEVTTGMSYRWDYKIFYEDGRMRRDSVASSGTELVSMAMEENIESIHYAFQVQDSYQNYKTVDFYLLPWPVCSGSCGDNADWNFDIDSNTLTVTGTGAVQAYSYSFDPMNGEISSDIPWHHLRAYIKRVVMSEGITDPGNNTFKGLDELRTLELPGSLERIPVRMLQESPADDIFFGGTCAQWRALEIPFPNGNLMAATVHCSDGNADMSAWSGSQTDWNLTDGTLTISGTGATWDYAVEDGGVPAWYNMKDQITTVNISEGITEIGGDNFNDMLNLTRVTIPEGVVAIGESAFQNAVSLESIDLPSTLKTINWYAFMGCRSLTEIRFRNGLETIGMMAFAGCENLSTAYIPVSVTQIGAGAFNGTGLTTVYYTGTQDQWSAIEIGENNAPLVNAQIVFGSQTDPATDSLPTPTNLKWNQAWHGQPENGMMYFEYEGDTAYGVVVSLYRDGVAQAIYEGDQWATVNTRADRPGVMLCHSAWFRFNSRDLESGTYYFTVKLVSDGGEESELATSPSWIYTAPNASVPAPEVNGIVYTAEKELAPDFTVTGSEEYPNIQFALEYRPDVNSEEGSKKVERSYGGQYNPISNSKPFMNETMRSDGYGEGWYRIGVMVNSSDITVAKNSETVYSEWQFISAGQIAGTEEPSDSLPAPTHVIWNQNWIGAPGDGMAHFEYESETKLDVVVSFYRVGEEQQAIYEGDEWAVMNEQPEGSGKWLCHSAWFKFNSRELENGSYFFTVKLVAGTEESEPVTSEYWTYTAPSVSVPSPEVNGIVYTAEKELVPDFTLMESEYAQGPQFILEYRSDVNSEAGSRQEKFSYRPDLDPVAEAKASMNETMHSEGYGEGWYRIGVMVNSSDITVAKNSETVYSEWQFISAGQIAGTVVSSLPLGTSTAVDNNVTARFAATAAGYYKIAYDPSDSRWGINVLDVASGEWSYYSGGTTLKLEENETVYFRPNYSQSGAPLKIVIKKITPPTADGVAVARAANVTNHSATFTFTYSITEATAENGYAVGIELAEDRAFTETRGRMSNMQTYAVANNETMTMTFSNFYPGQSFWYRAILVDNSNGNILKTGSAVYQLIITNNLNGYTRLTKDMAVVFRNGGENLFYYEAESAGMLGICSTGTATMSYTMDGNNSGGHSSQGGDLVYGTWLDQGQRIYISAYNPRTGSDGSGNTCTIEVKDGLGVLPSLEGGESVQIVPYIVASYTAQQDGLHQFSIDNEAYSLGYMLNDGVWRFTGRPTFSLELNQGDIVWIRFVGNYSAGGPAEITGCYVDRSAILENLKTAIANGEGYFDLRGLLRFELTEDLTIPQNMHVDFWGTQLEIPENVTLTVLGSMSGELTEIGGTVNVQGGHLYQNGILFTNNNAALNLNGNGGAVIPVDSWTDDMEAYVHFSGNSYLNLNDEAHSSEELNAAKGKIKKIPTDHITHWININFPWTLTAGRTETIPQNAAYEFANGGSLTVAKNATLNIYGGLKLRGTTAVFSGKVNNEGWLELEADDYGSMGQAILNSSGSFTGAGEIRVRTTTDPQSWLQGFDPACLQEKWSDAYGVSYTYTAGLFDALEAACNSGAEGYDLNDVAALTIMRDLTIPANMHVDAWNAVVTVPSGVTLTVNGFIGMKGVVIENGGTLRFGDGAHGNIAESIVRGDSAVFDLGRDVNLDISVMAWNRMTGDSRADIVFADESSRIWLYCEVQSDEGLQSALGELSVVSLPGGQEAHFGKNINIYYEWTPSNGFIMAEDTYWHVVNNGVELGSITIDPGNTLMMNGYLCLHGATMTVNGKLYNYGCIELQTENENNSVLSLGPDGEYEGDGSVQIKHENPESELFGFTDYTLSILWEDQWSTAYQLVEGVVPVYGYGDSFYANNTIPVQFMVKESGIYTMNVALPEGCEGWISIGNTPVEEWVLNEGGNEITTLLQQGVVYELSFGSDSASEAEIHLNEPQDAIISEEAWDIRATSAQLWVGLSVTEATAAAGDYVWGIKYSTDPTLPMNRWLLWGWNVDNQAYRLEFKPHDLCTLIPNTTYYYKAILFRTSETQEIAEVIAEEEAVHMITTAPAAEGEILPLNEGESRIVAKNTHQVFTFNAKAKVYYTVSGSNLDYLSFKESNGNPIYYFRANETGGERQNYGFFAVREDQTVYIGTGNHGTAQGDITVIEAVKTATALSADNPVTLNERAQAVKFTAPVTGWYEIAVTGSKARMAMVDFEKTTWYSPAWYSPGTAQNVYLEKGQTWVAIVGEAGSTVKVTRAGSDLAENLAYLGSRDGMYDFNIKEDLTITDAVTVPANVQLHIYSNVTVAEGGVLTNYSDIYIEQGGNLTIVYNMDQPENSGRLVLVDGGNGDGWKASVSLEGGSLNVTGDGVIYDNDSIIVVNCGSGNYGTWSEGLGHIQGVPGDRIQLEYPIYSEWELYDYMGSLTAYRQVNVLLEDGLELELTGELPGNFCLVINEGSSVTVPDGEEADVYGGFALEGGSLINNGTLNLYGFVNYQRSDSVFENNGELIVSGRIGVNSWHEGNTTGTLRNSGTISLVGGTIKPEVTVEGSEPQPIECIAIDEANFPDENFRTYVSDEIDTNDDGQLSDEEIDAVTEISVDGMEIGSLRGVEFFTKLEILSASGNDLTELDLSANTALTDLDVSNNRLSSLNLSNCPNLRTLDVTGNHLTRLDLRSCPGVSVASDDTVQLITEAPADIEITEANFPDPIFRSYITGFDTIDRDGILSAEEISAMNGEIDVSGRGISSLQGIGFFTELRSLKAANNSLTSLDLSGNADLTILDVCGNQIATLNISGCPALLNVVRNGIMLSQNGITRNWIEERDAQGQTVIIGELRRDASAQLITGEGVEIKVANFPDANFRAYVAAHFDLNGTGTLDAGEIANVTEISLWDENYEPVLVSNLQGIEFFPALNTLWVECNNVTSLDLSANQHLENLICKNNEKLTSVDLSHNTALRTLFIEDNKLSKLDVSANANLEMLHCGNNPLTVLDLSHNPALENLEIYGTRLSKLDVHLNERLRQVYGYNTPMTSFIPSEALETLILPNAKLSTLNVSNCPNLMHLSVTQNSLTTLDVSANSALLDLRCGNNRLTKLDVSANSGLSELDCKNNQLTNLTLGENSSLSVLNCSGNPKLANVDLSNCDNLKNEVTRSDRIVGLNSGIVTVSVDEQTVLTYDSATKLVLGQEELSGTCGAVGNGSNLTWTLDPAGTLNIAGSGAMKNFASAADTPWVLYDDSINSVLIGSAVTTIGTYAFAACQNLQEIHLSGKLPTIGANAFEGVIATIWFPGTLDYTKANRDPYAYGASGLVWIAEGGFDIWLDPNGGSFDGLSVGEAVDGFWYLTAREYEPAALYKQKVFGEAGVNMPIFEPTREGYVFQGWSQTATGGVRYKARQAFTENVNRTLYAVWKADTFKVNFNKNNDAATGNMKPQAMTVGKALALTANAFRYTNNAFVGWALTKDRADVGIVDFVNRENVSDVILLQKMAQYTASLEPGEENVFDGFNLYEEKEITFYAVWKSNAIAVKLYSEYEIADDGSTNYLAEQTLIAEGDTFTVDMSAIPSISLAAVVDPYCTDDEGSFLAAISADQNVKWTTSSAAIATVDETGTVRFVKPGTVTITATTTDGTNKRATVKFSIYYIDPGTRLTAKLAETSAWYEVPTSIGLQNGDIARINIYGADTTTPLDPDLFQYDIVTKGGEGYLEFISNGQVTAIQGDNKAISIKATLLNDPQKRSVAVNLKTIDPQTKVIDMTQEVTPGAGTDLTREDGVIYLEKKASVQTIKIIPHVENVATLQIPLKRGLLTYASTNRATATTAENADGAVTVTVPANATGAATITATSKDLAKTVGSLSVYVKDYEPRTDVKSVTLDTHMGTTAQVPLVVSNDNAITDVTFEEYDTASRSYKTSGRIVAELNTSDPTTAVVTIQANTGIPNSTVKGQLAVQTQRPNPNNIETGLYYYDLNVVSKSTLPAITVKQTPFNTFFKDSESTVTVTARNTQIEGVELKLNDETIFRSEGFYMDGESGVVTLLFDDREDIFPATGSTAAFNPTAAQKTGTLSIKLQGYVNPVQQPITVQTNNVRPTLKLSAASAILNPTLDGNVAATTLVDSKTNVPYDLNISNPTEQLVVADKTPLAAVSNEGSTFIVELNTYNAKGDLQGGRVTMNVQDDRWTQAIAYSYTLTVNNTMPKLTPTQATLTVNKLFPEVFATTTVISNQGGTNLSDVYFGDATITPATGKDKLSVTCIDGIITAAIADESIPNGTYTCTFAPEYRGTKLANMTVRVTVNNLQTTASLAPASVSLSGFCVTDEAATTIKLNNDNLSIMDVMVRDTKGADIYDPNYTGVVPFDIRYQDGSIVIRYRGGAVQKAASYTYQLVAIMNEGQQIMDNGGLYVQLAKPVNLTIRTVDDRPTLKAAKTSFTLNSAFGTTDSTGINLVNVPGQKIIALFEEPNNTTAATITGLSFEETFANGGVSGLTISVNPDKTAYSVPFKLTALVQRDDGVIESKPLVINIRAVNTTPNVTLTSPTLTINREKPGIAVSAINVPAGYSFAGFSEMEETGVYGDGNAILTLSNGRLQARLTQSAIDANKNGSYRFTLTPIVMDANTGLTAACSATITASVSNTSSRTWSVTVTPSGKLDAVQRFSDEGKLTYTITRMTGIQGIPTAATLENVGVGKYAELFQVSGVRINEKGQPYVVVSLKDRVDYATNINYNNLKLSFTFATADGAGERVDSQVLSLKVTQTALKLTANPTKQTFYQSQDKNRTVTYAIELTSPAYANMNDLNVSIGDIKLWQNAMKDQADDIRFELKKGSEGRILLVHVTLKDPAQLAAGRNYTLPVLIKAEGAASNMAATVVNLTLAVQK